MIFYIQDGGFYITFTLCSE